MSQLDEVYKKLNANPKVKKEEPVKEVPSDLPETEDDEEDMDDDEAEEEQPKKAEPVKQTKDSGKRDESKEDLSEQIEIFHNDGLFRQQLLVRLDEQNKALKAMVAILYRLIGDKDADK